VTKAAVLILGLLISVSAVAEISVIDFQGRTVTLKQPAQRIIALAPHIVENVFSAGAGHKLIGVVSYSNYPAAARDLPEVGSFKSWSLETIVALDPDLILMWKSGNGLNTLVSLTGLGLPVFVSEPRKLEDIPYVIRAIGKLAATEPQSEKEALRLELGFAQLRAKYAHHQPLGVLYQVWNDPLQTLNGDHMVSAVIELCGGRNAFADAISLAPKISIESVLFRDPQVIVASGMSAARPEWLDDWHAYPSLQAVQNNALIFVNPDHMQRATARLLLGAQDLCQQMALLRR
jgi:iron complex transport system substrate-binding protein